jgi:beta-lactamase class A
MSINWSAVEQAVEGANEQATVGVSMIGPGGETWEQSGDELFPAASTVKIGIMVEIYRKIDRGELALDDVHTLSRSEKAPGSGVLSKMHSGLQLTLGDLLYLMMSISDNTATNILIDYAEMGAVNATMREIGMERSNLSRKMLGRRAEGEPENLAAPNDYTRAIRSILDGEAASQASCAAMVATLEKQQNPRRIGLHVPREEGYRWGSKTGTLQDVCNDAGFIITPKGRLIVAVFIKDLEQPVVGEQIIAGITKAAMEASGTLGG